MTIHFKEYEIKFNGSPPAYSPTSSDNIDTYNFVYFDPNEYHFSNIWGIKIFQYEELLRSAVIGSGGGGTSPHETSVIIQDDSIYFCCGDSVFCLSIPDLQLIWKTKADTVTCFQIFYNEDYFIIHGEMEITKIDHNGNIIWQRRGNDIFLTLEGKDDFVITNKHIIATDFKYEKYVFDMNGNLLNK
jgi:outer membrane protein assembly factor BamB